jgi:ribosome maturation factor RimP
VTPSGRSKLEETLISVVNGKDAFLVGMEEQKERGRRVIKAFIDTDAGITIAQCAEINRELGAILESQNMINEPYELEISSPGIDRPLKLLRQYKKNLGRKFNVQYFRGDVRATMSGVLDAVDGEKLTFATEQRETITLEFSKIIESIEELPW